MFLHLNSTKALSRGGWGEVSWRKTSVCSPALITIDQCRGLCAGPLILHEKVGSLPIEPKTKMKKKTERNKIYSVQ